MEAFPNPLSSISPVSSLSTTLTVCPEPKRFHSLVFPTGDSYEGQLLFAHPCDDQETEPPVLHGVGVLSHSDGTTYRGEFLQGVKHGLGITLFPNGDKHVGRYKNNVYEGLGTYTSGDGAISYVGGFSGGEIDGNGVMKNLEDVTAPQPPADSYASEVSSAGSDSQESPTQETKRIWDWTELDQPPENSTQVYVDDQSEQSSIEVETEEMSAESDRALSWKTAETETMEDRQPDLPRKSSAAATFKGLSRHVRKGTKTFLRQKSWTNNRDPVERGPSFMS